MQEKAEDVVWMAGPRAAKQDWIMEFTVAQAGMVRGFMAV
jgi:hypothetical protein